MKKIMQLILIIILLYSFYTCNTTEPPPDNSSATLKLEDISCTEAWLSLTTANIQLPTTVDLNQNENKRETINLTTADTVLYIDSLLPNQTYKFKISSSENQVSSNEVNATTLDTTSNNFTFTKYTFGGDAGSCVLRDVAIINDTCIYAVGELNIADTSQNGYTLYCYLKWNGIQWKLGRLKYFPPGSVGDSATSHGYSVFAFGENDVWISGDALFHWDGSHWSTFYNTGGEDAKKMWGPDSSDLYAVGNGGHVAQYHNGVWSRIESGTSLNINDIYGAYNSKTNKYEILAPAANVLESYDRDLLQINNNVVTHLSTQPISSVLSSIWFKPNIKYYLAGDGIYIKNNLNEAKWKNKIFDITRYYTYKIRGNNLNGIVAAGGAGEIIYFNGMHWKSYINETQLPAGNYYGLDFKNNIIVAVGEDNPQAVITVGKRTN